jgi:hypothetical protein
MEPYKLSVALVLAGLAAVAAAQPDNLQGGVQAGTQAQAIAACKGRSSGASCNYVGSGNQTLSGTCFAPQGENLPLACRTDLAAKGAGGQGVGARGTQGQSGTATGGLEGGY